MNIMQLAADLARRVPEMAKDSTANNAELIAALIGNAWETDVSPCECKTTQPLPLEISLRDWLAGMAMQTLLAGNAAPSNSPWVGELAYKISDEMLSERGKK
jgi:hypothetical protein